MRLLFVSSTTVGGSGRSQRELADHLRRRGHEVAFVVDDDVPSRFVRWLYANLSDLAVRLRGRPGARLAAWLERRPGARARPVHVDGTVQSASPVPQNALARALDAARPDVVVGNSLERLAWRRVHEMCAARAVPTVLYVRETDSLEHLSHGDVPDLLVANAESLQAALVDRGFECAFVPSVIDVDVTRTASTRRVALAINPVESRGGDITWKVAARAPEIPFVVQESWPLDEPELSNVRAHVEALPNVEFRRSAPPGPGLYGDARVLLVPYRVDNRPRVIAEAQANGIPVIAADVPALREAIGDGGVTVPIDDIDEWVDALRSLWSDDERYRELTAAALAHSTRDEIDPGAVAGRFEALVVAAIERRDAHRA